MNDHEGLRRWSYRAWKKGFGDYEMMVYLIAKGPKAASLEDASKRLREHVLAIGSDQEQTLIGHILDVADTADVGLLVRVARTARRLKQADLADLAGALPQQVSALERGAYLHPAARNRILEVVGLTKQFP